MKIFFILIILLKIVSCIPSEEKSEALAFTTSKEDFTKYVNQKTLPTTPNLSIDKTISNDEYPIEIALYNDGQFYYMLENLGDGNGTWEFKNGKIRLFAKRRLFDMHIIIKALKEQATSVGIEFADRFGPQFLNMENKNMN
ncbi:MAG: hypothetical protein HN576_07495 [Bacteriovoracaceae bacterium]|jgi:hypothetical protein|nr:hypothetical protein [Bacteriovoracaceae bacterium]